MHALLAQAVIHAIDRRGIEQRFLRCCQFVPFEFDRFQSLVVLDFRRRIHIARIRARAGFFSTDTGQYLPGIPIGDRRDLDLAACFIKRQLQFLQAAAPFRRFKARLIHKCAVGSDSRTRCRHAGHRAACTGDSGKYFANRLNQFLWLPRQKIIGRYTVAIIVPLGIAILYHCLVVGGYRNERIAILIPVVESAIFGG